MLIKISIEIYEKNYNEAKQLLIQYAENEAKKEVNLLSKVCYNYSMGKVEYNLGNLDNARQCLQFVADNGNTLVCKSTAEELLKKINVQTVNP